ncbi:MAG: hypothetical protein KC656_04615 [Myxococcales bacterium]|nr:hypothetical protein [Myxococcales bacterium]
MNIEGLGLEVSGEWLQSMSTGLLFLLFAGWILYGIRRAQRAALWAEGVHTWASLGEVRPDGAGWRVTHGKGWARCRGGPTGVHTLIVDAGGSRTWVEGIATPDLLG